MSVSRANATGRFLLVAGVVLLLCITIGAASAQRCAQTCTFTPDAKIMARRDALLKLDGDSAKVIDQLTKALGDKDPLVTRTAARMLGDRVPGGLPGLTKALRSKDLLTRRIAALGMGAMGPDAIEPLAGALKDESPFVRQAAVISLATIRPSGPQILALLTDAGRDEDGFVSNAALRATAGAFALLDTIRLPKEGWKFVTDAERVGEDGNWFASDFDDSGWSDIEIEAVWQDFGHDYIGWSWYRRTIELPARDNAPRVEMLFEGVDESAWLWVNGQFIGAHDIGATGWDKPFRLDVTEALKWGQPNQITVRAMNTAHAGGIWRPVRILVMELAQ